MSFCKRDWYADWGCYECCAGDLCNYYVTVSKTDVKGPHFSRIQEFFLENWQTISYESEKNANKIFLEEANLFFGPTKKLKMGF